MIRPVRPPPGPFQRRMRYLLGVFGLLGLGGVGVGLLVLFVAGTSLVFLTIGIPVVIGTVWLTRVICDAERWLLRRLFGVSVDKPYGRWPSGHAGVQLLALSRDVTVWRDVAWRSVDMTLGLVVYLTYLVLLGTPLLIGTQPLLFLVFPDIFDAYLGFIAYESFAEAVVIGLPLFLIVLGMWWWVGDLMLHAYSRLAGILLRPPRSVRLEQRVVELTESRADTVDASAAELRRIERDLHDGAQARLVALGMSLGMAEESLRTDPDAAAELLAEARENSGIALSEIRDLVRGIHPPVLADRGLAGAVEAIALANPLPVTIDARLPGRAPAPVESAAYFAVVEALTNAAKYSQASVVRVRMGYFGSSGGPTTPRIGITVRDDGRGGARVTTGGGLAGVVRRLAVFDGTLAVDSPPGSGTVITIEVPCELMGALQMRARGVECGEWNDACCDRRGSCPARRWADSTAESPRL